VNNNFPLLKNLQDSLNEKQNSTLNLLLRMINTRVNNIRHVHEDKEFLGIEDKDGLSVNKLETNIMELLSIGITKEMIKKDLIPNLGFKYSSLPETIKILLK
jgi:hypothetical protein